MTSPLHADIPTLSGALMEESIREHLSCLFILSIEVISNEVIESRYIQRYWHPALRFTLNAHSRNGAGEPRCAPECRAGVPGVFADSMRSDRWRRRYPYGGIRYIWSVR